MCTGTVTFMRRYGLDPRTVVCMVYVTAMFMAAMDATIVNVAMVSASGELQVPPSAMGTINIGYLVSLAVFLPVSGWLGDRFGTKRVFLLALCVFTLASALCGTADSLAALNLFRMLQGAGGGLLTPVGMAILFRTFQPHERLSISRILMIPIALAPAVGPVLGGLLVEFATWRWVFYVNLLPGSVALLVGLLYLKEHREAGNDSFDWPGFLLATPGFAMLMYALAQGAVKGWHTWGIAGSGIAGILLVVSFVIVERRSARPMLRLSLFSEHPFRMMGIASQCVSAGLLGMLFVFPLMVQDAFRASALEAGLVTFPEALGLMLSSQLVPWLSSKWGPRKWITAAILGAACMFGLLSLVRQDTDPWLIRSVLLLSGFFLGNAVGIIQASAFGTIAPSAMGQASTLFQVQNRLGSGIGMAALTSILAAFETSSGGTSITGYRSAILVSILFLLAALIFARRVGESEFAKAMCKPMPPAAAKPAHTASGSEA